MFCELSALTLVAVVIGAPRELNPARMVRIPLPMLGAGLDWLSSPNAATQTFPEASMAIPVLMIGPTPVYVFDPDVYLPTVVGDKPRPAPVYVSAIVQSFGAPDNS